MRLVEITQMGLSQYRCTAANDAPEAKTWWFIDAHLVSQLNTKMAAIKYVLVGNWIAEASRSAQNTQYSECACAHSSPRGTVRVLCPIKSYDSHLDITILLSSIGPGLKAPYRVRAFDQDNFGASRPCIERSHVQIRSCYE